MNIYGSFGLLEADASVPVILQGEDLMSAIGLGARCDGGPLQPNLVVHEATLYPRSRTDTDLAILRRTECLKHSLAICYFRDMGH